MDWIVVHSMLDIVRIVPPGVHIVRVCVYNTSKRHVDRYKHSQILPFISYIVNSF